MQRTPHHIRNLTHALKDIRKATAHSGVERLGHLWGLVERELSSLDMMNSSGQAVADSILRGQRASRGGRAKFAAGEARASPKAKPKRRRVQSKGVAEEAVDIEARPGEALAGRWTGLDGEYVATVDDGFVVWPDGSRHALEPAEGGTFRVVVQGAALEARLASGGRLEWSDGDVWLQESRRPTAGAPPGPHAAEARPEHAAKKRARGKPEKPTPWNEAVERARVEYAARGLGKASLPKKGTPFGDLCREIYDRQSSRNPS